MTATNGVNAEGARLGGKVKGWNHWTTPKVVLDCVRRVSDIALDPCSNDNATVEAALNLWEHGLEHSWHHSIAGLGLAYVNPPYKGTAAWVKKCVEEAALGAEIILLVAARPDTQWTKACFHSAIAACFWEGRIKFGNPPPESPGDAPSIPSVLYYWGRNKTLFRNAFAPHGFCVDLQQARAFTSLPLVHA